MYVYSVGDQKIFIDSTIAQTNMSVHGKSHPKFREEEGNTNVYYFPIESILESLCLFLLLTHQ